MKKNITCHLMAFLLSSVVLHASETSQHVPAQESQSGTLRIVSYNIRHGAGMDGRIDLDRTAKVLAAQSPDLVALQEVDQGCTRSGKLDLAAELGRRLNMHPAFGKFMDFQGGEYGLAVLSRFPILKTTRHALPPGAEPRCALEIQVQPPGESTPLSFVCIHNDWTSETFRLKQVQTLLDALQERLHPVILAGDFNGERKDPSMQLLKNSGWDILDKQGAKTWPSREPKVEIDFIVLKNFQGQVQKHGVLPETEASDHRPIYAELSL